MVDVVRTHVIDRMNATESAGDMRITISLSIIQMFSWIQRHCAGGESYVLKNENHWTSKN